MTRIKDIIEKMPKLTGSDKQVAWANDIRANALLGAEDAVMRGRAADKAGMMPIYEIANFPTTDSLEEAASEVISALSEKPNAKDFIDARGRLSRQSVDAMVLNRARGIDAEKGRQRNA